MALSPSSCKIYNVGYLVNNTQLPASLPSLPKIKIKKKIIAIIIIIRKCTAKADQDNVNIGVVTIFRLANTSLLQVY